MTSALGIGLFVESVTTPANVAMVVTARRSTISVRPKRAADDTRNPAAWPLAPAVTARRLNAVSSGTPQSANRPRASAVAETHLGAAAPPAVFHSALTVPASEAVESSATLSLPSTIPPLPYPSPQAVPAICNALGTRTAIVVAAPETVTAAE